MKLWMNKIFFFVGIFVLMNLIVLKCQKLSKSVYKLNRIKLFKKKIMKIMNKEGLISIYK